MKINKFIKLFCYSILVPRMLYLRYPPYAPVNDLKISCYV